MSTTQFENIYFNQSRYPGQMRLAQSGLGWKMNKDKAGAKAATEPFLLEAQEVHGAIWSRGAKGYQVRVHTKNKGVYQFDGFDTEDLNSVKSSFKNNFETTVEVREHSVKGWNWGAADFERSELVFNVNNKPAFEIPYSEIANSNLVAKSEVAVEFNLQNASERTAAGDEIVEMRFYIPGTIAVDEEQEAKKKTKKEGSESDNESVEEVTEQSAAQVFYENLADRAHVGAVAGEAIVSFQAIMFLTPRGRYDILMYETSFNLRGKTYDYKLQYKNIKRLFLLPRPDDAHNIMVIQLTQPLRQGQTSYPFLIIQFPRDETLAVELNVEDDEYESKYKDKVKREYDEAAHQVVGQLFKGLSGKRTIFPSDFTSTQGQAAVNCSQKASEGYLYPLDRCFLFLPKPTLYIPLEEIDHITFSRVSGAVSSSRTFDMSISLKDKTEHQFSNIEREEQSGLEKFIKSKNIPIQDDLADQQALLQATLAAESEEEESDVDEVDMGRGSADEDSESPDEDFEADEGESDVAEEYDENASMSESGEEGEEMDVDDDDDESQGGSEEENRPKKKSKK